MLLSGKAIHHERLSVHERDAEHFAVIALCPNGSIGKTLRFDHAAAFVPAEAAEQEQRFRQFRQLAEKSGNIENGKNIFATACATCHSINGQGGQIGPVLSGAGASGTETLLRAILTPNAAMEAGYRNFRIELRDGEILDGFLVKENDNAFILRQPNLQDHRVEKDRVRRFDFTQKSLMPEGLLDSLQPTDVSDLFAYLKSLK